MDTLSSSVDLPLLPSITPSLFNFLCKANFFINSFYYRLFSCLRTDTVWTLDRYPYFCAYHLLFLSFVFFTFCLFFGFVWQIKLAYASFQAHVKQACHIVSNHVLCRVDILVHVCSAARLWCVSYHIVPYRVLCRCRSTRLRCAATESARPTQLRCSNSMASQSTSVNHLKVIID